MVDGSERKMAAGLPYFEIHISIHTGPVVAGIVSTYELIKDQFACTHRGKISAKGKGEIDMYFVECSESA